MPLSSILLPLTSLYAEDVRLSTYYPSPFGNYRQIQIQEANNADPTGALLQAGIDIITDYNVGNFTPGIFWSTLVNNPTIPKAGIWMQMNATGTGSLLYFGTSNAYGTGINGVAQSMVLDRNGNLGLGTANPTAAIQVQRDNGFRFMRLLNYADGGALTPTVEIGRSRGTSLAPTLPLAGSGLGQIDFMGGAANGGSGAWQFNTAASILASPTANWATTSFPTALIFSTTPALNTAPTERMRISDTGNVGIGTNNPGQRLSVEGTLGILEGGGGPTQHTIIQGGAQTADITYTLPTAQATAASMVLTNNGAGTLSWAAGGGASSGSMVRAVRLTVTNGVTDFVDLGLPIGRTISTVTILWEGSTWPIPDQFNIPGFWYSNCDADMSADRRQFRVTFRKQDGSVFTTIGSPITVYVSVAYS